jgi:acylphosphatase
LVTKRLEIKGEVQGVGYRASMSAAAHRIGVNGWVRNRRDGSVEAVVQGENRQVESIIEWARQGPGFAHVENVVVTDASGNFSEFSIQESL